jgi:hypothetical protein
VPGGATAADPSSTGATVEPVRRPSTMERPSILREASTRALSRVFEFALLVAVALVVFYVAFSWAAGPEVRDILLWLLSMIRKGTILVVSALDWVIGQLRQLG